MSETVKLIIEIPEDYYEILKSEVEHNLTDYYPFIVIGNGIPLDDVKAEIETLPIEKTAECRKAYMFASEFKVKVLEILDNIGKGDEE